MNRLFALTLVTVALAACSSMRNTPPSTTPAATSANPAETRNSSDANKSGNPAAVSPGTGAGTGSGGPGAGAGTR
jgi:hypothetical protein